jgi:Uma2 family endonuclease
MHTPPINVPPQLKITQEQFEQLAAANRDLCLERNATGELIVMPPTGGNTGKYNARLITRFVNWNEQTGLGEVFDSSTAFKLPNGADRSPDVAWVSLERWNALTPKQQDAFPPLCPDFVLELRSKTDNLEPLRQKMREYIANTLRLGWLIDTKNQKVEIYRPDQPVEVLEKPHTLSGEDVLPGFVLDLQFLWQR